MNLSPHFTLSELIISSTAARRGIDNIPGNAALANLKRTAEHLEDVQAILGHPILITSGFRCLELNRQIGSKDTSAHVRGLAVDFTCREFGEPLAVAMELLKHQRVLQFDQLIHEFKSWVHIGWTEGTPRGQLLTIDQSGTRTGFA